MSIFERIDGLLKIIDVPFYSKMPTFGEHEEPDLYIVYSLYDNAKERNDGRLTAVEYTVTVNVIGVNESDVDELKMRIISLFEENDLYYTGCTYNADNDFPQTVRRILDFKTINGGNLL